VFLTTLVYWGFYRLAVHRAQHTLESLVQKELVENQAAALDPAEIEASDVSSSKAQPASTDIPERIKKLPEFRDSGVITEEEFECKKGELLNLSAAEMTRSWSACIYVCWLLEIMP
jgi:hypothetical protein